MKKTVIILAGLAVLAGIGIVLFTKKSAPESQKETAKIQATAKPWVEVLKPLAVVTKFDGSTSSLQTGDEIEPGDTIKTDNSGLANIYFPDGSVIRLDLGTELKITEAEYDLPNQKLVVKLFVNLGRVWSKIVKLSTPDSVWEVNTSNAVATVRGTAFGVEFIQGKTTIIGSEHSVVVRLRDPVTKNLSQEEVVVSPNKFLEISETIASDLVARNASLANLVWSAPSSVLNRPWIKRAKVMDLELNRILNSFDTSTLNIEIIRGIKQTSVFIVVSSTDNISVVPDATDTSSLDTASDSSTIIIPSISPNLNTSIR